MESRLRNWLVEATRQGAIVLKKRIFQELERQGHKASGKAEQNATILLSRSSSDSWDASILIDDYVLSLNYKLPPSKIPFYPNSGNKQSEYILGLIAWLADIGATGDLLSQAFRVAFTQVTKRRGGKGEGRPTVGAFKHTDNGRRTGWVAQMRKRQVTDAIEQGMMWEEFGELIADCIGFEEQYTITLNVG